MKYYVTIYIDILKELRLFSGDFTHAFLGLTKGKSPDELDKIKLQRDVKYWDYSLGKMVTFRREEYKWYESLETNEFNDGFYGFAPVESDVSHWGRVFEK
ncbi:hypothetical protein NHP164001_20420 [Helicobacter trogontum]|uniref:Uncharacterized protein n=2 Tax=Helicobacter TaxID=209 RepID=A0ABQ0D6Q0_9HELI